MANSNQEKPLKLEPGAVHGPVPMRLIALDWQVRPVTDAWGRYVGDDRLVEELEVPRAKITNGRPEFDVIPAMDGSGVYAFEGRQDAHPERGILYIGQSQGSGDEPSDAALPKRVLQSVKKFVAAPRERRIFGDCHDVVLRWARVEGGSKAIDEVESLLIRAHCPAFNAQEVRGYYRTGNPDLVVMSAGAKGRLLPVVAAAYHAKEPWEDFE